MLITRTDELVEFVLPCGTRTSLRIDLVSAVSLALERGSARGLIASLLIEFADGSPRKVVSGALEMLALIQQRIVEVMLDVPAAPQAVRA